VSLGGRRAQPRGATPDADGFAPGFYNRERLEGLIAGLKKYRNERFAAGDKTSASHALGAIFLLDRKASPGENPFLLRLCVWSMQAAIEAGNAESRDCAH
jgi:hypothetical protein